MLWQMQTYASREALFACSPAPRWRPCRSGALGVKHSPSGMRRPYNLVILRHSRRTDTAIVRAEAPAWNPQNVPNPKVMPSPEFSAEEAVRVQLDALSTNDEPWPNHGVQTMYEFGYDIGGLEPSFYFGRRRDMYHLDHFAGCFQNELGELVNCSSYSIEGVEEGPAGNEGPDAMVRARVRDSTGGQEVLVEVQLKRRQFGSKKGAFMTSMIKKMAAPE